MEYKVRYLGPESMFTHPGITRVGIHPYVFVGNAYTTVAKEDYELFKTMGAFAVLGDVDIVTASEAVAKETRTPKKTKKGDE